MNLWEWIVWNLAGRQRNGRGPAAPPTIRRFNETADRCMKQSDELSGTIRREKHKQTLRRIFEKEATA